MAPKDETRDGGVLAGLPRTRPQRRSERRKAAPARKSPRAKAASKRSPAAAKPAAAPRSKPAAAKATKPTGAKTAESRPLRQPAQPRNVPRQPPRAAPPEPPADDAPHLVGTAVQAAGELAQIGLTVGTQILRGALSKLPRP